MNRRMHRFLSLLMVLALVCSMIPAALAADSRDYEWDSDYENLLDYYRNCRVDGHTPSSSGYLTTCRVCGATGYLDDYYDDDYSDHNHEYTYYNNRYHYEECFEYNTCPYWEKTLSSHSHSSYCIYCGYGYSSGGSYGDLIWRYDENCDLYNNHRPEYDETVDGYDYYTCDCGDWARVPTESYDHEHVLSYNKIDEDWHEEWCTVLGCDYEDIAYHDQYCDCFESTVSDGLILTKTDNLSSGNTYTYGDTDVYVAVSAELDSDVTGTYTYEFKWDGNYWGDAHNSADSSYVSLDTDLPSCTVSCTVTATNTADNTKLTGTVSWSATAGAIIEVDAVVYNTNSGYAFGDMDDEGGSSIEAQISAAVSELGSYRTDYVLDYVVFGDVRESGGTLSANTRTKYYYDYSSGSGYYSYDPLNEVLFCPTDDYEGTVTFPFTAYYYDSNSYYTSDPTPATGIITFNVKKDDLAFDVLYTALAGDDVVLDENDFVDFWEEQYPNGTLDYVRFSVSSSKGKLYSAADKQVTSSTKCYYSPTNANHTALDGVTFVPKNSTMTFVEISFTASGTTRKTGTSSTTLSGTVTILYTAKNVTPIEYQIDGFYMNLNPADFIAKYKEVMGVTSTVNGSSLTIRLLNAPLYGTLYLDTSSNDYFFNYGTELTEEDLPGYRFNCRTNTLNGIEDVSYAPGAALNTDETISYACYYGGTLKFIGTITLSMADPVLIEYTTAGATPVTLSRADFVSTSLTADALYFGTPSSGTLYRNYANGTGTAVTAYDKFGVSTLSYNSYSVSTLTYVPAAGYVGVVEIPFYASTAAMAKPVGTLKIYVGRAFTDVVGKYAWSAPYINKLSAQGVINGKTLTTYCPGDNLKYGEALKTIMMAAGYPEQAKLGTHWASGYLLMAYRDGLVSSASIDLEQYIDRETIAVIAAKALGLQSAAKVNANIVGPTDTTNGYVYALYNAGIVNGDNSSGKNCYYGSSLLTRAELSKIICNVSAYHEANN